MAHTFTTAEYDKLVAASQAMTLTSATELPFDSTIIERTAVVAVSSGFSVSTGAFLEACKLNPISTLLNFIAYIGAP
jgi:hypothetical protein